MTSSLPLYDFGLSQEDARSEARALSLSPDDRVLSVASAGDMPLNLLAIGARKVDAVDISASQLHLTQLKHAAVLALEPYEALGLLGFMPASPQQRQAWLRATAPRLSQPARVFWTHHPEAVEAGVIWQGRFERYIRSLVRRLLPVFGKRRFEALFAATSLEEQVVVFDRDFDRRWLCSVFDLAFHPKVYGRRGVDTQALSQRTSAEPLGQQFFRRFRWLCTATPASQNTLLQLVLLGRILSEEAAPGYLSPDGASILRAHPERLSLHHRDFLSFLRAQPESVFDKAHLSNLPDWMDAAGFADTMVEVVRTLAPGGRFVWRYIHADRPLPENLGAVVEMDARLAEELVQHDRFPFYGFQCGRVVSSPLATPVRHASGPARRRPDALAPDDDELGESHGVTFRTLGRADGPTLEEINRASPIEADLTLSFTRGQDFFAWPDRLYERYQYVGGFVDNQLVGYGMVGVRTGRVDGAWRPCFYGGDARVLPDFRGRRIAESILQWALSLLPGETTVGFGIVKKENLPALHTVMGLGTSHMRYAGTLELEVSSLVPAFPIPGTAGSARPARADDIPALVDLFEAATQGRLMAPRVTEASFDDAGPTPLASTWVVEGRGGALDGMLSLWNQAGFHETRVLRYSPAASVLRGAYRALRRGGPPLPAPGEAFVERTVTGLAIRGRRHAVFAQLLAAAAMAARRDGVHLVHVGMTRRDPLRRALRGWPRQRARASVFVGASADWSGSHDVEATDPYIDMALI